MDLECVVHLDVMLNDYQTDTVTKEVHHIDFYIVNLTEEMDVEVTVNLIGEAVGSKEGGIVQQSSYELQVRAMHRDIPEEINVNIDELDIGDSISVSDLPVSDLYEFLYYKDTTIFTILLPNDGDEETD